MERCSSGHSLSSVDGVKKYYREPQHRVFVNRSMNMNKIKFFGFDMDYTLAVYKSPQYESLGFKLLQDRLIKIGYPNELLNFAYDPSFPVRGLWFDTRHGMLLKVDTFGHILVCVHGFKFMKGSEILSYYPNKFIQFDPNRIFILNTLFNLPEAYMYACIIDYFCHESSEYTVITGGVKCGDTIMYYRSIHQDVRSAVDWVHQEGLLKQITLDNLSDFVIKDPSIPTLVKRMKDHNRFVFLVTNSDYNYTNKLMEYLFDSIDENGDTVSWLSYFDAVVVSSKKPLFFDEGTLLRRVDYKTGKLMIGHHATNDLKNNHVYAGGSCKVFTDMIGAKGRDVLYIGDHIFGDILKSKKMQGWRTFLVIPELDTELHVWTDKCEFFHRLEDLDAQLTDVYRNLDSSNNEHPDVSQIHSAIREVSHKMDMSYGKMGSLFRAGSRLTFFSHQTMRYADLYAASFVNLMKYPFSYQFKAPALLMPHESTVGHETQFVPSSPMLYRSGSLADFDDSSVFLDGASRKVSECIRATTPIQMTQVQDDDDDDDDEDVENLDPDRDLADESTDSSNSTTSQAITSGYEIDPGVTAPLNQMTGASACSSVLLHD